MNTEQEKSPEPFSGLVVSPQEDGMKVLRFLERRLSGAIGQAQLHKWIRTGQVRINGKRSKGHDELHGGDLVRIPPQAFAYAPQSALEGSRPDAAALLHCPLRQALGPEDCMDRSTVLGPDLPVLALNGSVLIIHKPCGLAVQGGTKISDSVTARLGRVFSGHSFIPAPVHRLDKPVSGLLAVALDYGAAKRLSAEFSRPGLVQKDYLALVQGATPFQKTTFAYADFSASSAHSGKGGTVLPEQGELVPYVDEPGWLQERLSRLEPGQGVLTLRELGRYSLVKNVLGSCRAASLVHISLLTGKKRQIRLQLAALGFPILGDRRFGGASAPRLFLHACRLGFSDGLLHAAEPDWPAFLKESVFWPHGWFR